jgi:hypothetical protein
MVNKIFLFLGAYVLFDALTNTRAKVGKTNNTALVKTKFFPVYSELPTKNRKGKTNLGFCKGKSGVYLIKEDGVLVYVGFSGSDLYKTILRHFSWWMDKRHYYEKQNSIFQRITYVNTLNKKDYTVRVILCDPTRAWNLEKALIDKHAFNLRDNTQKYRLYFKENANCKK